MNKILTCICLIILNTGTGFAGEVFVSGSTSDLEQKQKIFLQEYVNAVNADDLHKLKSLIHPQSLSCITEENREFHDDQFSNQLKKNIPGDCKMYVKEVEPDEKLPFSEFVSYPVRPTHLFQISYEVGKNKGASLMIFAVNHNDRYFLVQQCPKPELIEKYRENKISDENRKRRSKELFVKLKDPLLSQLTSLLDQGKEIQAIKRYSAETGESLAIAKEVIDLLEIGRGSPEKDSGGSRRDR